MTNVPSSSERSSSGAATTSEPSNFPRDPVLALSAAAFLSGASLRLTDALLPLFAHEFGVPIGRAAGVITTFSVAYGLSQLFFGPVGDRFGKYRVIAWACAACSVTALLCGLADGFVQLALARLVAGATAAAVIPLSMAWIGDVVPYENRQPVLARFLIGQILGLSAGVFVGGFAADHLNWRLPFFGIAACFVGVSAVLFVIDKGLPERARQRRHAEGPALRRMVAEFGQVLARPWARVVLVSVFLEGAFLFGAFAFIATHLHQRFGLTLGLAGSTVMVFGFGGLLFAVTARALVDRLGEVGLAWVGGVLLSGALLVVGLAPAWWWALPACFVAGLGFYMVHNTLQTNATQMAPERRGAAVAAFASNFYFGQAIGVAADGLLAAAVGTGPAIAVGAVGVLAVAGTFGWMRSKRGSVTA